MMDLIFEKSVKGRRGLSIPRPDVSVKARVPDKYRRKEPADCLNYHVLI